MVARSDIEFFFDPICPFAWVTSRWITDVAPQRDATVEWRFISLSMVNESRDYATDFPPAYPVLHGLGRTVLRVAAAAREEGGNDAVAALYEAAGQLLHVDGLNVSLWKGEPVPDDLIDRVLADAGLPSGLAGAADDPRHDEVLRSETELALSRTGDDVGTPILTFDPGLATESSLFGPVISKAPKGDDALELFDAVRTLARTHTFAELKRSLRDPIEFG
jgi:2-hydroxychromene-2-carboxylate isomerase